MSTLLTDGTAICSDDPPWSPDDAQLAAAAFLACSRAPAHSRPAGTICATTSSGPPTTNSTCSQRLGPISRYVLLHDGTAWVAASTIDRRLSTVCWRSPRLRRHPRSHPCFKSLVQYVRRPTVQPTEQHLWIAASSDAFCSPPSSTTEPRRRSPCRSASTASRSDACATNIENLAFECGDRIQRIVGKGNKPAVIPLGTVYVCTIISPSANVTRARSCCVATDSDSIDEPRTAGCDRSDGEPELARSIPTCCALRSSRPALNAGVPLRDAQFAARHADPRTTTIYGRRRQNFDRDAAYVVVAFVASG